MFAALHCSAAGLVLSWGELKFWGCCFPSPAGPSQLGSKMAQRDEAVREFVAVTDVDEERARFFLESAGWDLQVRSLRMCFDCAGMITRCSGRFKRLFLWTSAAWTSLSG